MDASSTGSGGSHPATMPPPLTAHLGEMAHAGSDHQGHGINLGREKVHWGPEVWQRIDRAVAEEVHRTRVAGRFLPHHRVDPHVTYVPADTVLSSIGGGPFVLPLAVAPPVPPLLNVDDTATTRMIETWVEFSLTPQQIEQEAKMQAPQGSHHDRHDSHAGAAAAPAMPGAHPSHHKHHGFSTAVTVATRATNALVRGEDTVLFTGTSSIAANTLFTSQLVLNRVTAPFDSGLLVVSPGGLGAGQVISVPATAPRVAGGPATYSEATVAAIKSSLHQSAKWGSLRTLRVRLVDLSLCGCICAAAHDTDSAGGSHQSSDD